MKLVKCERTSYARPSVASLWFWNGVVSRHNEISKNASIRCVPRMSAHLLHCCRCSGMEVVRSTRFQGPANGWS